jgi:hypothetical protein
MFSERERVCSFRPIESFWRSLRHREEAPLDGLSACTHWHGDVGVVEGAPIDASSDDDLPSLGVNSDDE